MVGVARYLQIDAYRKQLINKLNLADFYFKGFIDDKEVAKIIRKVLKDPKIIIKRHYSNSAEPDRFITSSFYDPEEDAKPYELYLIFYKKNIVRKYTKTWRYIKNEIADSLTHEYVHHLQHLSGADFTVGPGDDLEYYMDRHELDAHAVNAAYELIDSYGTNKINFDALVQVYRTQPVPLQDCSMTLWDYAKHFPAESPTWKRFFKKVYVHYCWLTEARYKFIYDRSSIFIQ